LAERRDVRRRVPEDVVSFKYRAFLSYSHRDRTWGEWLHRALENYRIDGDLVGRETPVGPVPKTLRPIFRDRDDFSASHSLTEQTLAALQASQFLIVICSPNAAKSHYVNEEVRRFKAMGRAERVIAIIVDGGPSDGEQEYFPPAVRFQVGADGAIVHERDDPIAADARREGDGKQLALQKVVAASIGVPLDDLRKRDAIADNRRIKWVTAAAAVFAALALVTGFLVFDHLRREARDEARDKLIAGLTAQLVGRAEAAPGRTQALGDAITATVKGAIEGDDRLQRAVELLKAGKTAEAELLFRAVAEDKAARVKQDSKDAAAAFRHLGVIAGLADPKRAREAYGRAVALDPEDREALYWHGWLQLIAGDLALAERDLNRLLKGALAAGDERGIYQGYLRLTDLLTARGNLSGAREHSQQAHQIAKRAVERNPNDPEWQRDFSVSYNTVGDVLVAQGKAQEALQFFREGFAIRERLGKADPNNTSRQRDLSVSHERIGDIYLSQGDSQAAIEQYQASLDRMVPIRDRNPANLDFQRFTSVTHGKVGDALVAQGKLPDALKSFNASLAIADRLAKTDPGNAEWQRDVSVAHDQIGDVLVAEGKLSEALRSYSASLAIADRLARTAPDNAGWQRDLSVSYSKIGTLLMKQNKPEEALPNFRADVAIAEKLAVMDPSNAEWQRDLLISHRQVVDALRTIGVGKLTRDQSRWLQESEARLAELAKR
jgi:tetratricopeptide (TPR) repeat protein